jgi:hypothetical protein
MIKCIINFDKLILLLKHFSLKDNFKIRWINMLKIIIYSYIIYIIILSYFRSNIVFYSIILQNWHAMKIMIAPVRSIDLPRLYEHPCSII